MAAFLKACNTATNKTKNVGIECSKALGVTYMYFFGDTSFSFTDQDIEDAGGLTAYFNQQIHASGVGKFFPIGGSNNKIWNITDNNGSDITETSPIDNRTNTLQNGATNRVLEFTEGGLCYAKALLSLADAGNLGIIELDASAMANAKINDDESYGFLPVTINKLAPLLATPTSSYKNRLGLSYNPIDFVNSMETLQGETSMLSLNGLKDVYISSAAVATQTSVTIDVKTSCADTDLGVQYGDTFTEADFAINKLGGTAPNYTRTPVAITGIAYTNGHEVLSFDSQPANTLLEISGATSAQWFTDDVVGYEAITPVLITVPALAVVTLSSSTPNASTARGTQSQLYITGLNAPVSETPTTITGTLNGTFTSGALNVLQLYSNSTPDMLNSPVQIGSNVSATSFASGATFSFTNTATYSAGTVYFILVASIASGATVSQTIIASKLAISGLTGSVTDNQPNPGTTKTIS